ncbi:hypothetical protein Anas_05122 [Armadillidium nasatum]|uniref:NHL repeat-containing protein 2 n=1 Tax=Armadillidium nasatum TaxID=96803 RepID=A0A5N5SHL3_9CRUS|nr:hypothetical protein Anas_05122 [Armadillidium nasatum]
MENEDETVYGVTEPARNIPELALASLTLINSFQENEENEEALIFKHLDTYVKGNHLSPLSFKNIDLDALEEKYNPNSSPVVVIGIHSAKFDNERTTKGVCDALKRYNITHPVANDVKCKLWYNLGISCWPTLLIAGPNGLPLFVLMGEGKKNLLFKFVESSLKYFDKMKSLEPKHLPLLPHLHLPSEESGLYYPGKIHSFSEGLIISDSGNNRILITDHEGNVKMI